MTLALSRPWVRTAAYVGAGLSAALALPFLVHLLPAAGGPPAGARLLPIFFAGLVLVLRGAPMPALAVAVLAPLLNRLVTGMPAGPMLPTLMLELSLFTLVVAAAVRYLPRAARFAGPVAYLVAAATARLVLVPEASHVAAFVGTLAIAWPGLVMLLAVGALTGPRRAGRAPA